MLVPTWFTNVESSWDESPFARFFRGLAGFARAEKAAATLSTPIRTSSHNSSPMWLVTTLPAPRDKPSHRTLACPLIRSNKGSSGWSKQSSALSAPFVKLT